LKTAIVVIWIAFWAYWLLAAVGAKPGLHHRRRLPAIGVAAIAVVLARSLRGEDLTVNDVALEALGTAAVVAGLGLAISARIHLGRNWGMPMTEKEQPELVTDGPYRFVRNPIYTGLLLALLGTGLATNLYALVALALAGPYFIYSARVEERNLAHAFPATYPAYRARTKMLIPFVL